MSDNPSARQEDVNGYITIENNPISRSGVFQYLGKSIGAPEPDKIYNVYRAPEEFNAEALETFKLIPFVDDHVMLGPEEQGLTPAEAKGVHGATGEKIEFRDGVLYATIKIFSQFLKNMLQQGKRELSLGYRCTYEKSPGDHLGQAYEYIQKNLQGNHLALVDEARCAVAVLDGKPKFAFDTFDLNIGADTMADKDEDKNKETKDAEGSEGEKGEMSLEECHTFMKEFMPKLGKINELMKKHGSESVKDEDMELAGATDKSVKDAMEKKMEADKAAKDKAAKDAEEKEKSDKEKEGMDKKFNALAADFADFKKTGMKSFAKESNKRNALLERLTPHVGTFDASEMTVDEVAAYGVDKLKLSCAKGHELAALEGFLHNRQPGLDSISLALDGSAGNAAGKGKLSGIIKKSKVA